MGEQEGATSKDGADVKLCEVEFLPYGGGILFPLLVRALHLLQIWLTAYKTGAAGHTKNAVYRIGGTKTMYSHSPGSNVNIEFVPRHKLTDREIGRNCFDAGQLLPACPSRAMTNGFNCRRREALAYQVSMAKRVLDKAGHDISELDEAIKEMVVAKCGIEKAIYGYNGNDTEPDVNDRRLQIMCRMQQWYRSPNSKGAVILSPAIEQE